MRRTLCLGALLALAACGQTPTQTAADFACLADANNTIVGVINQTAAPGTTNVVKGVTAVTSLTMLSATDPNCLSAISSLQKSKSTPTTGVAPVTAPPVVTVPPPLPAAPVAPATKPST